MPPVYACHCHQCERRSGSAFGQRVAAGGRNPGGRPIEIYEKTTEDRACRQRACGSCHTRIYNTNTRRPGIAAVRAGTLDQSEDLDCRAHIFTAYRQRWFVLPEAVPQWPEAPPPDEFITAMMT